MMLKTNKKKGLGMRAMAKGKKNVLGLIILGPRKPFLFHRIRCMLIFLARNKCG